MTSFFQEPVIADTPSEMGGTSGALPSPSTMKCSGVHCGVDKLYQCLHTHTLSLSVLLSLFLPLTIGLVLGTGWLIISHFVWGSHLTHALIFSPVFPALTWPCIIYSLFSLNLASWGVESAERVLKCKSLSLEAKGQMSGPPSSSVGWETSLHLQGKLWPERHTTLLWQGYLGRKMFIRGFLWSLGWQGRPHCTWGSPRVPLKSFLASRTRWATAHICWLKTALGANEGLLGPSSQPRTVKSA